MKPVLESVSAVSCTCEQTLTEMATHGPLAEHYNILEVQSHSFFFINKLYFIICDRHFFQFLTHFSCLRQIWEIVKISFMESAVAFDIYNS